MIRSARLRIPGFQFPERSLSTTVKKEVFSGRGEHNLGFVTIVNNVTGKVSAAEFASFTESKNGVYHLVFGVAGSSDTIVLSYSGEHPSQFTKIEYHHGSVTNGQREERRLRYMLLSGHSSFK